MKNIDPKCEYWTSPREKSHGNMSGTKKPTLCDKGSLRNTDTLQSAPSGKVILRSPTGSRNTDRPSSTAIGDNLVTRRNPWQENTNWRRQTARNRPNSPCIVSNPLRCCDFTRLGTNDPLRTRKSLLLFCFATTLAKCFLHEVNDVTGNRLEQKFIISAHQRSKRFNLHLYLADHKLTPLFALYSLCTIFENIMQTCSDHLVGEFGRPTLQGSTRSCYTS